MLNSLRAADEAVILIDSSIFSLEALEKFQIYCQDIQEMTRKLGFKPRPYRATFGLVFVYKYVIILLV